METLQLPFLRMFFFTICHIKISFLIFAIKVQVIRGVKMVWPIKRLDLRRKTGADKGTNG